jgi:hypothetical protein
MATVVVKINQTRSGIHRPPCRNSRLDGCTDGRLVRLRFKPSSLSHATRWRTDMSAPQSIAEAHRDFWNGDAPLALPIAYIGQLGRVADQSGTLFPARG